MIRREPGAVHGAARPLAFLDVLQPGPYASVQDLGRPGLGALGVGMSGACDRSSLRLANRLLGNPEGAAAVEVTAGGLVLRTGGDVLVAVTGAPAPVFVDERPAPASAPVALPAGAVLRLGLPGRGLRTYVAVRGGLTVGATLGSRSTDVLAGLGPAALQAGQRLPVGRPAGAWNPVDIAPVELDGSDPRWLRIRVGPREDRFTAAALVTLRSASYEVTSASNRVGLRLAGPRLEFDTNEELPSEGMVPGALQVPPSGLPTLLLPDHPVTGGYPVIAVVVDDDLDAAGQTRPGQRLRFRVVGQG